MMLAGTSPGNARACSRLWRFTADETVPLMNDTTNKELLFYKKHSFWSNTDFVEINRDDDDIEPKVVYCVRSVSLTPHSVVAWSICTNCWSVGIGAGYKLFLHRNATNHLRDHSVSSTRHCGCGDGS